MTYEAGKYDCVVIGAGHAGCEAALAASRLGCRTLLMTLNMENIAQMDCNPSIGGPAKGHLVREIDALGGEMGLNIDQTYLQMQLLNTSKGPAVYALRAQADKREYQKRMLRVLQRQPNLDLKQALCEDIIVDEHKKIEAVVTENGAVYRTKTAILCTGTYLRGKIIIGEVAYSGGPNGQRSADKLSQSMKRLGIELNRFKTGTPARVDGASLDFSKMIKREGETKPYYFSFLTTEGTGKNEPCYLSYTNQKTHAVIKDNLHLSPLYSGMIEGTGPRYCPSLEDKVVRFADKDRHQTFLEPEGLSTTEMYVQGMSSSLPEEVQLKFLSTIGGMENVKVTRSGYAIEYDCIVPTQLKLSLEMKETDGLFCAGQINGSSGYEEAAAQGLIAGINAALKIKNKEPLVLKRSEAYIGVLIDDLVTKGTNEPYRMMTSRAEYRLLLRQDNADLRLTPMGRKIGLVSDKRYEQFLSKRTLLEQTFKKLKETNVSQSSPEIAELLACKQSAPLQQGTTLYAVLRRTEINYSDLLEAGLAEELPRDVIEQIDIQVKYEGYIEKQAGHARRFEKLENRQLPPDLPYEEIRGLALEARQKLSKIRPSSLGQAGRISGVSPADISVLLVFLEQQRRRGLSAEKKRADGEGTDG